MSKGAGVNEGKKRGLWDNIHAKRKRGEAPAKKGDKDYPKTLNVEGAAWTKKAGKNKEGGLNEKGRKSYERENPGSDLKAPQPEGGSRKKSFCARMGGMKKKLTSSKTANDPDSRINKSLRKWKCNEEKKVGEKRHPRDQKELDRAQAFIKKNPNFGKVSEAKEEQGRSDYGKASVRNKRKFGREGEPAVFDASGDRGKMIDQRRSDHKAKRGVKEGVMDVVKKYRNKQDEKKPQKAQDAGAKARRSLQRREYASKVSGTTENVPDNLRDHKTWDQFKKHI